MELQNEKNLFKKLPSAELKILFDRLCENASKDMAALRQFHCRAPEKPNYEAAVELFSVVSYLIHTVESVMDSKRYYYRVKKDAESALAAWEKIRERQVTKLLRERADEVRGIKTKDERIAHVEQFLEVELQRKLALLEGIKDQACTWYGQVEIVCEKANDMKNLAALLFKIWQDLNTDKGSMYGTRQSFTATSKALGGARNEMQGNLDEAPEDMKYNPGTIEIVDGFQAF